MDKVQPNKQSNVFERAVYLLKIAIWISVVFSLLCFLLFDGYTYKSISEYLSIMGKRFWASGIIGLSAYITILNDGGYLRTIWKRAGEKRLQGQLVFLRFVVLRSIYLTIGAILMFLATIGAFVYAFAALIGFITFLVGLYEWGAAGGIVSRVYITVFVLFMGIGFFAFRLKWRCIYGFIEAALGVFIGLHRSNLRLNNLIKDEDAVVALMTASIYLIVRGLDNIHAGLDKTPNDPLAKTIKKYSPARIRADWLAFRRKEMKAGGINTSPDGSGDLEK